MSGRNPAIFVAAFTVVLLAAAGGYLVLQTYTPPTSASPPVTPEIRQFSIHLQSSPAGEKVIRHWVPAVIVVNSGDTVILKVTNGDPEKTHGFQLAAFNIMPTPIPPGEAVTFRIRATRPGVYHFGCSFLGCAADHADQTGQLVVLGSP